MRHRNLIRLLTSPSVLVILCWIAVTSGLPAATKAAPKGPDIEQASPNRYVIGPGDVLTINVWKEPEASVPTVVVRSDGMISVPIVKEVQAAGLTTGELEKALAEQFARYFRGADISVIVKEIHSQKVYVIGAVKKEGPIDVKAPLTVLQAVAEAGGLSDYAKRTKIYILRKENGKEVRYPFDYTAVIRGEHGEQNVTLHPGDTIVVPQ